MSRIKEISNGGFCQICHKIGTVSKDLSHSFSFEFFLRF